MQCNVTDLRARYGCGTIDSQGQADLIEAARTEAAVAYSVITALQERCRVASSSGNINDYQLMAQVKKGVRNPFSNFVKQFVAEVTVLNHVSSMSCWRV